MNATVNQHIDGVLKVVRNQKGTAADDVILSSWLRSRDDFAVDPASLLSPRLLTQRELRPLQEPIERCLEVAQVELDRLFKLVRSTHYVVLLCNPDGTVIDHRGEEKEANEFRYWGIWLGGVWAESVEGTNGIGTCISEQRAVTVHRSQHYRARHIDLSCSGAPIFGPHGELAGILDISSFNPELSEGAHSLTGALVSAAARVIEERLFRDAYCRDWILAMQLPGAPDSGMLLAVNGDQRIVGADRIGRGVLRTWGHSPGADLAFAAIFERNDELFARKSGDSDVWTHLRPVGGDDRWLTIASGPKRRGTACLRLGTHDSHLTPRLDILLNGNPAFREQTKLRGGLAPATLRRVREYIDAHLDQNLSVEALAAVAGLSIYHFAREFKNAEGLTPHEYLLERRLAKAFELLHQPELTLAGIASRTGFADQSHFSRRFKAATGVSPGQYRRIQKRR